MLTPRDTPEAKLKCAKDKCRAVFPKPNSDMVFEGWQQADLERTAEADGWKYGRDGAGQPYAWRCKRDAHELLIVAKTVYGRAYAR